MNEVRISAMHYPYIRDIGTTLTEPGWIHPNRVADYNVLIYCIQGQLQVFEADTEYLLRDNQILFLKRGKHHWGGEGTMPGTSTVWVHFYDSCGGAESREQGDAPRPLPKMPAPGILTPGDYDFTILLPKTIRVGGMPQSMKRLTEINALNYAPQSLKHLYLSMELMALLLGLHRDSQPGNPRNKSEALAQKLAVFLEAHCGEKLDTERIQAHFQHNYRYLTTLFKAKYGMALSKYHERLRIQKAAELLKKTSMNITEVSYEVQFESPYYFSRVFKKVMGESPSEYLRNVYRMNNELDRHLH
ncbi:AraC family transcriptional regulator [Cohnella sp. GCM10020058]|uniref:helix-turn-helix transcriptional regulator n=1 Tax=Cohnella sp. GCM10020058 TaxID=3317330 RepID=UPI003626559B